MATDSAGYQSWKQKVSEALEGMLYISETEAPLVLLETGLVADLEGLQEFIQSDAGTGKEAQELMGAEQLLSKIHNAADPQDAVIQEYAAKFDKLFELLAQKATAIHVIRVQGLKHLIYIAGNGPGGSLLIRTEAVET